MLSALGSAQSTVSRDRRRPTLVRRAGCVSVAAIGMTNPIITIKRKRLLLLTVLAALAVALPATSAAASVANPDPGLIARWEPCEPNTGVTVIVDEQTLGEGKVYVGCALGAQPDGAQALEHAGFELEGTENYGLAFICRIDGEPTSAEQSCTTTPGAGAYWSYWRGKSGGRWGYSHLGVASPESRSSINSVEGWSFGSGSAPRIQPMDGGGASSFGLPPEQASSVIPARMASPWLASTLDETAEEAEVQEPKKLSEHVEPELALRGAVVLTQGGVADTALRRVVDWLQRSGEEADTTVEGIALHNYLSLGESPMHPAARLALAVLGLQALGQNPSNFAGMDLRATLEGRIEKTGQLKSEGEAVEVTAPTVLALARTGTLSAKAQKTLALIFAKQEQSGSFGLTSIDVEAVEALAAAREQGAGTIGRSELEAVETALARAGAYLEGIQEPDGGVRRGEGDEPDVESTALGAVGLALAGRQAAGERAARWVSRYQVTTEYAGEGNPGTGEPVPAEDLVGAFLPSEVLLRNALVSGLPASPFGVFYQAQRPTIDALAALVTTGPYGPYDAAFQQRSLFYETRTVSSRSKALAATVTNDDVRPVTISGAAIEGPEAGDFAIAADGCSGRTLAPGESCEASASFDPTATGLREALLVLTLGNSQPLSLALTGTGETAKEPEPIGGGHEPAVTEDRGSSAGSQGVLGIQTVSPLRVGAVRLDRAGVASGLVGVGWQILEAGAVHAWMIAAKPAGSRGGYVSRLSGAGNVTSAELKLPAGAVYELQITFTDAFAATITMPIGRVVVPYDDRSSVLHYHGHWQRLEQAGAWLDTITRGTSGAVVSLRLAAGRPVFELRASSRGAVVEVRAGSHHGRFAIAKGPAPAPRTITAGTRTQAGAVSLRVLKGTVDLDGVALED
jgi:hypothetical protein